MGGSLSRSAKTVSRAVPKHKVLDPSSTPTLEQDLNVSNEKLLNNLRSVYVESKTIVPDTPTSSKQKLPQNRTSPVHDPLDITDPVDGYLTVKQVIQVLDGHRLKPKESNEVLLSAGLYKMELSDMNNLLQYFGNYYVRTDERKEKFELTYHPLHR